MKALLDTSVLVPTFEPGQTAPDLSDFDDVLVSVLSFTELAIGVRTIADVTVLRRRMTRMTALRELFGQGLPFDDACLRAYERLLDHLADNGGDVKARRFDRLIAACALANGATLVTRNADHVRNLAPLIDIVVR